ncbi:hypothetical protein MKL33_06665 [Acinetobacter sp. AOR43_HL]|uniref:Nmad5 family putative nucleotide modification protein n=1 Tax=Acinetobacter TaxID=469 RepID=UPI00222162F9|nr:MULTISPECIES: Nmad5 family putative nucleotide modification protein [Acinetobacter]MCW1507650.1 Nmad5 family putative nucleotide modification protein [Acinetobacter baumannii]MDA3451524.1 hypothetical protein [Acinetobacter sp. AOR43_HL]
MSRLTKTLREAMLETILTHAFDSKQKTAHQNKIICGEKIYQDIYSTNLIAMESLPKGFLPRSRHIYIAIAGQMHIVNFSEIRLIGSSHGDRHGNKAKLYVGDEAVAVDFLKSVEICSDLEKQRNSMRSEVQALLDSVQTFKKLWEVWPESKTLLEKFEEKPAIAILPAVQVQRLNEVLGLTVEAV